MRLASYDIVFSEIPGEVTLALNLSECPCHCEGCHSTHLWGETGEVLDDALLDGLLEQYGSSVSCVCLMGGDREPDEAARMGRIIKKRGLRSAWYSGREQMPPLDAFDYVKLGPWVAARGGLDSPTTNQRLLRVNGSAVEDITHRMRKTHP